MLAVIAIISVGFAFILVTKGYIRIGKPKNQTVNTQTETKENTDELESNETIEIESSDVDDSEQFPDLAVIPLEPIIVNLRGSFGRRYLKITVNLGVKDEGVGESDKKKKKREGKSSIPVKETVEGKLVEIRDILISVLSAKSIDDVDGWADQDMIRDEIRDVLNGKLRLDKGISKVFFTEFVVQ